MSDAFFQLQKTIAEVGRLQASLIAENQRLRDENKRLRELVEGGD
jgi:regulator of replication initiation timing